MSKKSKVYLIINFRNSSKTLKKCFESLILQSYKNIYFVLFDHSSSDNSKQILINLIRKYDVKNYQFLYANKNKSLVQCRNLAVEFVLSKAKQNDFLAFCDSDDWWHPYWLQSLISKDIFSRDIIYCDGYTQLPDKKINFNSTYEYPRLLYWHSIGIGTMIIKISFLRKYFKNKIFDEKCTIVYDTEFLIAIHGKVNVYKVNGRYFTYNKSNISTTANVLQVIKEWEYIRSKYNIKNFFKYHSRSVWFFFRELVLYFKIRFKK